MNFRSISRLGLAGCVLLSTLAAQELTSDRISKDMLDADAATFTGYGFGPTIEELIRTGRKYDAVNQTFVVTSELDEEKDKVPDKPYNSRKELRGLTMNSDLAIIGTPLRRTSALTVGHRFIFSDYEVRVDSVIAKPKNSEVDRKLVISRPGGSLTLEGKKARAIVEEYPLFRLGSPYLFFLHHNRSGSYYAGARDVFILSGKTVDSTRTHKRADFSDRNLSDIIDDIQIDASHKREVIQ